MLHGEMRDVEERGMKSFGAFDSSEKTISKLRDRWRPHKAKQGGDTMGKGFRVIHGKKRNEHLNVRGVFINGRNSAPYRKRCVVNDQTTEAGNK